MTHGKRFDPAQVSKLEDPERLTWMPPDEVVAALELERGMTVADVGAGTGYFSLPIAVAVAPGAVYAVDVEPQLLALLDVKLGAPKAPDNIRLVQAEATQTTIADGVCDRVLLANVWHEFDDRAAVLRECARILRPGGRVAILDWRADVQQPPGPPLDHRVTLDQCKNSLSENGWRVLRMVDIGMYSYLVTAQPGLEAVVQR